MMLFKNDEDKRSTAYRTVTVIALVVLLLIVFIFMRSAYAGDPLKGGWSEAESGMKLTFDGDGALTVVSSEPFDGREVELSMKYSLDRDSRMTSFRIDSAALSETIGEEPEELAEEIRSFAEDLEQSYAYSVDGNELTLTDAESGETTVFYR